MNFFTEVLIPLILVVRYFFEIAVRLIILAAAPQQTDDI